MPKNARARLWNIKAGADGRKWSQWPLGDKPGGAGYSINFTTAAIQDPMSDGGIWTNNTQGTGGNGVMSTLQSMRIALASDSATKILQHAANPADNNYEDPFAFVPGISGNQRVTATVWRDPAYTPAGNHEIEIILGCVVYGTGNRRWVECLWGSAAGQVDIALQDGPNAGFSIIGNISNLGGAPQHGDQMIAELNRSAQTVNWWAKRGGTTYLQATIDWTVPNGGIDATIQSKLDSLGDGAGCAGYMVTGGGTNPGGIGFSDFLVETF